MTKIWRYLVVAAVLSVAAACGSAGAEKPSPAPSPAAVSVITHEQECLYALTENAAMGTTPTGGTVLPECAVLSQDERDEVGRLLVEAVQNLSKEGQNG